MDEDYVLLDYPGAGGSVCARRARALRQWEAMRADYEYARRSTGAGGTAAVNQADTFIQNIVPTNRRTAVAWQRCQSILTEVPGEILVADGVDLGAPPVAVRRNDQRIVMTAAFPMLVDPLLATLVDAVDHNDILKCLQTHDPVSWHCQRRQAQQTQAVPARRK